ncbi:MAG: ABC transmembrane type-1 domain-containing protein [Xylanivirga thermophila]|jgi:putative aldouronate transport system permease protein|uniref:carbohydrate ABC transporter permease n=1 Tax=Xylanivirga thermophila TaxID=2496273 RepID=UPI0039F44A39
MKKSGGEIALDIIIYILLILVLITTLYPFIYAFAIAFNEGIDASKGGIYLFPRKFTLDNFKAVFSNHEIFSAFFISVSRTVIGTIGTLLFTGLFAYSVSHNDLMFRNHYMRIMLFSMYFSGGLIPYFILLKTLKLYNNYLVYIVPYLFNSYYAILMMSFFRGIPAALEESARIDGANDLIIFFKIIVPVSTPVLATIALFSGVMHWNSWFDSVFFVPNKNLKTLAFYLYDLVNKANITSMGNAQIDSKASAYALQTYTAETIRMATMIVVIVPIIIIYPFLQKYFVKGIMIGSIKG